MTNDATKHKPLTDGPWTIGPVPNFLRYQVVGEEDAEELVILGHGHTDTHIAAVIRHAKFGRVLDPIPISANVVADGLTVADLRPFRTWSREVTDCPTHGRIPRWLRRWMRARWEVLEGCSYCEYVYHYRTCHGCGYCLSNGNGTVPPCLDVITAGHKLFYLPGELETIYARLAQISGAGTGDEQFGGITIEPRSVKEFQGLCAGARAIREELELRGYEPVTVVNLAG